MVLMAELAAVALLLTVQKEHPRLHEPGDSPTILATSTSSPSSSLTKQTKQAPADSRAEARDAEQYFTKCMTDWDAATHMTKQEWAKTCRRVSINRAKFRHQNQLESVP